MEDQFSSLGQLKMILRCQYPDFAVTEGWDNEDSHPYLDLYKPFSKGTSPQGLKYLPSFHVLVSVFSNNSGVESFYFSLVTFHGTVVEELELEVESSLAKEQKIDMLGELHSDKLCYCNGISFISAETLKKKTSLQKLKEHFYIEQFQSEAKVRSSRCKRVVKHDVVANKNNELVQAVSCEECAKFSVIESATESFDCQDDLTDMISGVYVKEEMVEIKQEEFADAKLEDFQGETDDDIDYHLIEEDEQGFQQLVPDDKNGKILMEDYTSSDDKAKLLFGCKICLKTYSQKRYLKHCMRMHSQKCDLYEAVECPLCSQDISRRIDVTQHFMQKHMEEKLICCPLCLHVTDHKNNLLRKHILSKHHSGKQKKSCLTCGAAFNDQRALDRHITKKHLTVNNSSTENSDEIGLVKRTRAGKGTKSNEKPRRRDLVATYAGKKIFLRKDVEYHLIEDSPKGAVVLPGRPFFHEKDRKEYYTCPDDDTRLLFRCKICMKTYTKGDYLMKCMVVHKELCNLDEAVKCPLCSHHIPRRMDVADHFLECHSNEGKMGCPLCLQVTQNSENFLRRHILSQHHSDLKKKLLCNSCGEAFLSPRGLRDHMGRKHKDQSIVCQVCGQKFGSEPLLNSHIRIKHRTKPLKCLYCDKVFTSLTTIQKHLDLHSGYKPYKCAHCNYFTHKKSTLYPHVQKTHSKELESTDVLVFEEEYLKMRAQVDKEMKVVTQNTK